MSPGTGVDELAMARDPVEELAEAFLERYRRGERPALTEFIERAPEHADEIRELFPALVLMERASPESTGPPGPRTQSDPLERLGEYRIIREVGRGGMGVVYEAEQEALGRRVALKVLPHGATNDARCLLRFRREARSAARLHHTNIVPVFDVGERDGVHYYAMQFIRGQSLDEVITELRHLRNGEPPASMATERAEGHAASRLAASLLTADFQFGELASQPPRPAATDSPGSVASQSSSLLTLTDRTDPSSRSDAHYYRSVARIGMQVANALAYAHGQRVLHRDIKPSNLLLDAHGTVWVTDFGLAKEEGDDLTRTGDIVGTLRYMAPERLSGVSDPRSDVYSLGLTLYELLTLRPAFVETDRVRLVHSLSKDEPIQPRKCDPHVPRDLETIVLKAIAKEPGRRYSSAEELEEDLRRFLADRPIRARRASTRERMWRWCRRNRGWAATIATVAGLLLISAVGGTLLSFYLQRALSEAEQANEEKSEKLREAHLQRARALRSSGKVGQRFEALKSIREAAKIRMGTDLCDEAVAALVLPDVAVAREWEGHPEGTTEWTCDAKFERYARINKEGEIAVCRLTDEGEEILFHIPKQPGDGLSSWGLRMSPDGRFLVHGHSSPQQSVAGQVRVWKLDGPAPTIHFNVPEGLCLFALAFDADGRRMAIGHPNIGMVSVYDLERGARTRQLALGQAPNVVAFQPQGNRLAVACAGAIRLFDTETGRELPALRDPKVDVWTYSLAWHPGGRMLAATTRFHRIHLWDADAGTQVMPPLEGFAVSLTFNSTGDRLFGYDWGEMARLWDSGTGHLLLTMPGRFESSVETQPAVLSRDGTLLGVERSGTTLRLWRLADGRELRTIRRAGADPAETLLGPVLDAEGRILAAASNRGMGFYDLDSGNELAFVRFENENLMCPRRFDRSTGWLTSGNRSAILWPTRWDAADSTLHVGPPRLRTSATDTGMDSSLDGRIQAFPQGNRTRVLDRDRPGWFFDLGPQQDVRHCAVSPDGRWIATCTWHPNPTVLAPCVRLWEIQGDGGRYVKDLPIDALATASFSPNGRWLVTHSSRGSQLWEVGTWRPLRQFKTNACWSADGQLLATHDRTGEIVFVEPESGSTVLRLIGPQEGHYFAAGMTPDGTRLISSVGDGTTGLRVWDLRLIREQLRELGMDWDLPEFDPKRVRPTPVRPVAVQLDPGIFRQPLFDDPRQAVGALSLLIDLQPFNAEWYFQRGLACGRLNQSASAVADYEMFLSLTPSSEPRRAEVHFRRASNYMENLKDDRKAMAALLDAADAPPERMPWPEQYASRCNHYAWQAVKPSSLTSSPEIVLRLARSAVKYEPHNFMYQNTLGVAQYRSGHHAEAVRCLQANLDRSREFIAFDLYVLAMSYHRLGDSAQARDCFDRANAAVAAGKSLSAGHRQELAAFRAEAEGVLGMKLQP